MQPMLEIDPQHRDDRFVHSPGAIIACTGVPVGIAGGLDVRPPTRARVLAVAEVRDLAGEARACLPSDDLEGPIELGGDGGGDGALDERRLAQHDALAATVIEQVDRHLGGEHRASQIHQHQDAVV